VTYVVIGHFCCTIERLKYLAEEVLKKLPCLQCLEIGKKKADDRELWSTTLGEREKGLDIFCLMGIILKGKILLTFCRAMCYY